MKVKYSISCKHCSYETELDLEENIQNLSTKLICSKCNKRSPSIKRVYPPSEDKIVSGEWSSLIEGVRAKVESEVFQIEHRTDLKDDEKVTKMVHYAAASCAGVAIQPIPFADIFILTPIQAYFGTRIAAIRGIPVSESEVSDQIKELIGIMGMGFMAQQLAIGVWKTVTFGAGGLLTIPLVYALSYAVMKVIARYYTAKAKGEKLSNDQVKAMFRAAYKEGKAKDYKNDC